MRRTLSSPAVWVALALAGALVMPAPLARACSCAVPGPDGARAAAAAVFEGVVVRHEATEEGQAAVATFRVDRVWKGSVGRTVTIRTPGVNTMCPPHFEVGQRYIVYADGPPEDPHVRSCARYAAGERLAEERAALGRPLRRLPAR